MDEIRLQQVLPRVFANRDRITSDIWHRDLTFRKGERCLIEAASGTGKSSLCSYLYGYRRDYEGIITFGGKNIRALDTAGWTALRRRSLSLLFQELRLFPELTALENVWLKNRLTGHKTRREILALFEAAGIADKADERTGTLSFGQQQRVAFIRCLCQPFDFILLDEPVSHLDENNAQALARLLDEEAGRQTCPWHTTTPINSEPNEQTDMETPAPARQHRPTDWLLPGQPLRHGHRAAGRAGLL